MPWWFGRRWRGPWPGNGPFSYLPPWERPGWKFGRGACWYAYLENTGYYKKFYDEYRKYMDQYMLNEKESLEYEMNYLEKRLEAIKKRLEELKK